MKHMKEIRIPSELKFILEKTTCDICEKTINDEKTRFDVNQITFEHRKGASYPESSYGETLSIDFCEECFLKLVKRLKLEGCDPTITDWDY